MKRRLLGPKKNIRARENAMTKKNHARQLTLKNIHAMAKKNSYKKFDNQKNSRGSKIPHPLP